METQQMEPLCFRMGKSIKKVYIAFWRRIYMGIYISEMEAYD